MSLLYTAYTGTAAAQAGLNAVSQNIANVQTDGYSRQGVDLTADAGQGNWSGGVQVSALTRFNDGYKNLQLWAANSNLGQATAPAQYLTQLQQVMGDTTSNIDNGFDGFFAALNAASVDPASSPLRQQVITAASALGQRFNSLATVVSDQRTAVDQQRTATVAQINTLSRNIADLNKQIATAQGVGGNTAALADTRDQAVDTLSNLVSVQVVTQKDGTLSVSLSGGQPLVVSTRASTMQAVTQLDGSQVLKLAFANQTFTMNSSGKVGGSLGGLDSFETGTLRPLAAAVTDMATAVATQVNTQLTAGYGVDGSPGSDLFVVDTSSSSQLLSVAPGATATGLGFSANATTPGNSDQLLALIDLRNTPTAVTSLGTVQLGDANTQLVGNLGMAGGQNKAQLTTAQSVRDQSLANWKSTSGVDSDEEATHLLSYQQMYQANMKVISVANQLFNSVLAMFP